MNFFVAFAKPAKLMHPAIRYGFLAIILAVLLIDIGTQLEFPEPYPRRNLNLAVGLMLLFNHLAFNFRWPQAVTVALRLLAVGWLIFWSFCIFRVSFA
jgi:hypothetical protein